MNSKQVTEQNKALVRQFIEAYNRKDIDVFRDIFAETYTDHLASTPQGREVVAQHAAILHAAFPDLEISVEDVLAEGDKVSAHLL